MNLGRVGRAYFAMYLGAGVFLPYFPLWLDHLGYAGWQIGVVTGLSPVLRWTSAITTAWLADRWRCRWALLVGLGVAGTLATMPLLFVRDFGAMVAVMAVMGVVQGPLLPLLDATVLDHLDDLGGDYGRLRLWGSVSFVVGAFAGAMLTGPFGPAVVPILVVAANLPLLPVLLRLPRGQQGHPEHFRPPWMLLTPPIRALLGTAFLLNLSSGAWNGFFAVHVANLGLPSSVPGLAWGLAVVAEVGLLFWGRRILGIVEPAGVVLLVLVVTVVRWALTAVVQREALVVAVQLGHAFTYSGFHLATQMLLARLVAPVNRTSGQALYGGIAFGLGGTLGLLLAGALVARLGTAGLFAFEAGVAALGAVPALALRRRLRGAP